MYQSPYNPYTAYQNPAPVRTYPQGVQANMSPLEQQRCVQSNPSLNTGNYPYQVQDIFKVVPVASYDEAKAIPTNFMGGTTILTDFSHGMIYTKTLDVNTGNSVFQAFKYVPEEPVAPLAPEYDAKSEIEKLKQELAHICQELGIEKEVD